MTVNDISLTDSSGSAGSQEQEVVRNDDSEPELSDNSSDSRLKCFEWAPKAPGELTCDLCPENVAKVSQFDHQNELKIHQMQYHINPHYLSPGDRLLAKVTNFDVNTKNPSSPWVPDFHEFLGLYRCHSCFSVWDSGLVLKQHLLSCRQCDMGEDGGEPVSGENTPLKQFRRRKKRRKSESDASALEQNVEKIDLGDVENVESVDTEIDNLANKDKDIPPLPSESVVAESESVVIEAQEQTLCNEESVQNCSAQNLEPAAIEEKSDDVSQLKDNKRSVRKPKAKSTEGAESVEFSNKTTKRTTKTAKRSIKPATKSVDDLAKRTKSVAKTSKTKIATSIIASAEPPTKNAKSLNRKIKSNEAETESEVVVKTKCGKNQTRNAESSSKATESPIKATDSPGQTIESPSKSSESSPAKNRKRPERKCKNTTKSLMMLSYDENFIDEDDEFSSDESSDDEKVVENGETESTPTSLESEPQSQSEEPQRIEEATSEEMVQAKPVKSHRIIQNVDSVQEIKDLKPSEDETKDDEQPSKDAGATTTTTSNKTGSKSAREPKKGLKKGATLQTSKKKTVIQKKTIVVKGKKGVKSESDNKKAPKAKMSLRQKKKNDPIPDDAKTAPQAPTPPIIVSPTKRVEDVLPDLIPPRSGRQPSRRSMEAEKSAAIIEHVVEGDKHFCCFTCLKYFPNFHQFSDHKNSLVCVPELASGVEKKPEGESGTSHGSILNCNSYDACKSKTDRFNDVCDEEYSKFTSEAISRVPEFTFNSMHGTIKDIDSIEAKIFRSKPNMGTTIDKVKMNFNGPWTTKEVWESGGWEIGTADYLTWQKYENRWSENRRFLMGMSHLPWTEQIRFKKVYDKALLAKNGKSAKKVSVDESTLGSFDKKFSAKKQHALITSLDLRQTSKSAKYMNNSEREEAKVKVAKQERLEQLTQEASKVSGYLNGEWERTHNFVCGACNANFDELREALHHKWDDHPYCLVAHFTLHNQLALPPSGMMYPQTGRRMSQHRGAKRTISKGRKSSPKSQQICSKCFRNDFIDLVSFHTHILECGGEVDWDSTTKKGKKKSRKSKNPGSLKPLKRTSSRDGTESDDSNGNNKNKEEALKRKQRFERFNRPVPTRDLGVGRFTRLQAEQIKKESKKKTKGKKKKTPTKKPQPVPTETEAQETTKTPQPEAKSAQVQTKGKKAKLKPVEPVVSQRPRRSIGNYFSTSKKEEQEDAKPEVVKPEVVEPEEVKPELVEPNEDKPDDANPAKPAEPETNDIAEHNEIKVEEATTVVPSQTDANVESRVGESDILILSPPEKDEVKIEFESQPQSTAASEKMQKRRDLKIVKELVSEMLDKVEKAVVVISKAEEMNLSVESAKNQLSSNSCNRKRKRKSDAPTRIIQVTDKVEDKEEIPSTSIAAKIDDSVSKNAITEPVEKMSKPVATAPTPKITQSLKEKKSILMSALTPRVKSGEPESKCQTPNKSFERPQNQSAQTNSSLEAYFKEPSPVRSHAAPRSDLADGLLAQRARPMPSPPLPSTSAASDVFKEPTPVPSTSQASIIDAAERTRLEIVKDYLSRVAIAQVLAKQMLARESAQSTQSSMETFLEARRWSLLQQSMASMSSSSLATESSNETLINPFAPPSASPASLFGASILSSALTSATNRSSQPTSPSSVNLTHPLFQAAVQANLPSVPSVIESDAKKKELLASMAFLQPIASMQPESLKNSQASADPGHLGEKSAYTQPPPLSVLLGAADQTPTSTNSLRMFRKNSFKSASDSVTKPETPSPTNAMQPSDVPEDLTVKSIRGTEKTIFKINSETSVTLVNGEDGESFTPNKNSDGDDSKSLPLKKKSDRKDSKALTPRKKSPEEDSESLPPKKNSDGNGSESLTPRKKSTEEASESFTPKKNSDVDGSESLPLKKKSDRKDSESLTPRKKSTEEASESFTPNKNSDVDDSKSLPLRKKSDGEDSESFPLKKKSVSPNKNENRKTPMKAEKKSSSSILQNMLSESCDNHEEEKEVQRSPRKSKSDSKPLSEEVPVEQNQSPKKKRGRNLKENTESASAKSEHYNNQTETIDLDDKPLSKLKKVHAKPKLVNGINDDTKTDQETNESLSSEQLKTKNQSKKKGGRSKKIDITEEASQKPELVSDALIERLQSEKLVEQTSGKKRIGRPRKSLSVQPAVEPETKVIPDSVPVDESATKSDSNEMFTEKHDASKTSGESISKIEVSQDLPLKQESLEFPPQKTSGKKLVGKTRKSSQHLNDLPSQDSNEENLSNNNDRLSITEISNKRKQNKAKRNSLPPKLESIYSSLVDGLESSKSTSESSSAQMSSQETDKEVTIKSEEPSKQSISSSSKYDEIDLTENSKYKVDDQNHINSSLHLNESNFKSNDNESCETNSKIDIYNLKDEQEEDPEETSLARRISKNKKKSAKTENAVSTQKDETIEKGSAKRKSSQDCSEEMSKGRQKKQAVIKTCSDQLVNTNHSIEVLNVAPIEAKVDKDLQSEQPPQVDKDEILSENKEAQKDNKKFNKRASKKIASQEIASEPLREINSVHNHSEMVLSCDDNLSDSEENIPLMSKRKSGHKVKPSTKVENHHHDSVLEIAMDGCEFGDILKQTKTETKKKGKVKKIINEEDRSGRKIENLEAAIEKPDADSKPAANHSSKSTLSDSGDKPSRKINHNNSEPVQRFAAKSHPAGSDIFDFKTDDDDEEENWPETFRLKAKVSRPRKRSVSYTSSPRAGTPPSKRERFFSEDFPGTDQVRENFFPNKSVSENVSSQELDSEDQHDETRTDNEDQSVYRGLKRRRSSFANSFYSQAPRRKVLRRTAARISMERASESEALMTAIFDDSDISNDKVETVAKAAVESEKLKSQDDLFDSLLASENTSQNLKKVPEAKKQIQSEPASLKEQPGPTNNEKTTESTNEKPKNDSNNDTPTKDVSEIAFNGNGAAEMTIEELARLTGIPEELLEWDRPKRQRRSVQNPTQIDMDNNRVIYPLEVRACAVDRIRQGASQAQVARDLDCPVSTVAGWWYKRDQIAKALNLNNDQEDTKEKTELVTKASPPKQMKGNTKQVMKTKKSLSSSKLCLPSKKRKKAKKVHLTKKAILSSIKSKAKFSNGKSDISDVESSTSGQPSPYDFVSSEDSSSCSFPENQNGKIENSFSAARKIIDKNVSQIVNCERLFREDQQTSETGNETVSHKDAFDQDQSIVFTESEDTDDDDRENVNQGIKNQILKNCFASMAARHT